MTWTTRCCNNNNEQYGNLSGNRGLAAPAPTKQTGQMKLKPYMLPTALGAMLLTQSCVMDHPAPCEALLRVHFTYLHSRENDADPEHEIDLFGAEVDNVAVVLYDADKGTFLESRTFRTEDMGPDHTVEWTVPYGSYNVVNWGGVNSRHTIDNAGLLENHSLSINGAEVEQQEEHVWHNLLAGVKVDGDTTVTHHADMHKITNNVLVTVTSVNGAALEAPTEARISATNGRYDFRRAMTATVPTLYRPASDTESDPFRHSHLFTVMRLHKGDDSQLSVSYGVEKVEKVKRNVGNGEGEEVAEKVTIYDGPLSPMLARIPYADLDLDDEWHLDFQVEPGPPGAFVVTVTVNGWKIIQYDVSLQ